MDLQERVASPEKIEQSMEPAPEAQREDPSVEHAQDHEAPTQAPKDTFNSANDGGLHDLRATAYSGTKHRAANLELGTQVGADGKPLGAPQPVKEGKTPDATHVSIVASEKAPLTLAAGAAPTEADLFTRSAKGGKSVGFRSGTPAAPNVTPTMEPDNLFIGGAPTVEDIRQGGLGDCYFQSCLIGLTQNDPAKIKSVMSFTGHEVAVTLQRFDAKTSTHVPVTTKTSTSLLTRKTKSGGISLVGSGMRVAPAPKQSKWWASVSGNTVEVHRQDMYETALWAPMMEKAYADFAERFGSTGHGKSKDEKKLGSGYKIINAGGAVEECYQMFYGDAAAASTQDMSFTPGKNIINDNIPALQKLLRYEAQKGNTGAGQTQTFMHARMSDNGAVTRGDALVDQVMGLLFFQQLGDDITGALNPGSVAEQIQRLTRTIDRTALQTALTNLQTTLKGNIAGTVGVKQVAKDAEAVAVPDKFPHLWDPTMPAPFRNLRENLGILLNLGDDSSNKQRMNYTSHAYEVHGVHLADKTGAALALTSADLPALAAAIAPEKSAVQMHNPHATNEPDMRGTGPADGKDDGQFTYTLDQFLRCFDLLRMNDVSH